MAIDSHELDKSKRLSNYSIDAICRLIYLLFIVDTSYTVKDFDEFNALQGCLTNFK